MATFYKLSTIYLISILGFLTFSQDFAIHKIEPKNWWAGMKFNQIQLMVYGKNLSEAEVRFDTKDIKILKHHKIENSDYAFLDILISENIEPDNYTLYFSNGGKTTSAEFPVFSRENNEQNHKGFNPTDVIYLITPDRFSNGDTLNDNISGMLEGLDRQNRIGRHGGDIQGIINKLDYLQNLGITSIWINPLVENNTHVSYHGYSATDFYNIDARFGTNKLYKKLVEEAHQRGLKIIMDHVSNHISIDHPWMKNLPMPDWINGSIENHYPAVHHKMVLSDIHADTRTKEMQQQGWFVDAMPDLNQKNQYVAKYIIQNTIWWIESTGLDGIREDTYPYADQKFLADWAAAILNEYPTLNIVGEVWTGNTGLIANYQTGSYLPKAYDSNLPSVTDFPLRDILYGFLKGEKDLYHIYETLSLDYLYPDPDNMLTFIDNHDVARVMLVAESNLKKAKLALTILLTTRGIPQILYATEIGMKGTEDHGILRSDFPGGFPGDARDAFTENGRSEQENDIFSFLQSLLKIRKEHPALSLGKLTHLPPFNDMYVYFREYENERVMVIINGSNETKTLDLNNFIDFLGNSVKIKKLYNNSFLDTSPNFMSALEAHGFCILVF